jgi:hypothetical protein
LLAVLGFLKKHNLKVFYVQSFMEIGWLESLFAGKKYDSELFSFLNSRAPAQTTE